MATFTHHRLLSAILGSLLLSTLISVTAARPCKTYLISSYSFSFQSNPNPNFIKSNLIPNPNSIDNTNNLDLLFTRPIQFQNYHPKPQDHDNFARISTTSSMSSSFSVPEYIVRMTKRQVFPDFPQFPTEHEQRGFLRLLHGDDDGIGNDDSAFGLFDSLRDRTRDVLSVVVALLFGVGCGALTAGTMYFVYAVFRSSAWSRYGDYDSDSDEEEDIFSPKKGGYVMVPSKAEESTPIKQLDIVVEPLVNKD